MRRTRMLSILLAVLLVFSFSAAALAAEPMTVTVETKTDAVSAGNEVTLAVSIAGNPGFTNYQWTLEYDADSLELKNVENKLGGLLRTREEEGKAFLGLINDQPIAEDGTALLVTFVVKQNAAEGLSEVKISSKKLASLDKTVDAQYVAGGVTIADSTGGTGSTTGGTGSTTGGTGSTTGGTGSTTGGTGSTTGGTGSTTGGTGSTTGGTGSTTGGTGSTTGGTGSTTGGTGSTTGGTGSTTGGTGSTTGGTGSTTGGTGSTTGGTGSTTGGTGSTTGGTGSTTGGTGSTTGGDTSAIKVRDIAVGSENYSVTDRTVTVTSPIACKFGYLEGGKYVAIAPTANGDGSYSFEVPAGITEVVLVVKGDANGDGKVDLEDVIAAMTAWANNNALSAAAQLAADTDGNDVIDLEDVIAIMTAWANNRSLNW